jgi:WD40 repeat protein
VDDRELEGEVTLWNAETGRLHRKFMKHAAGVFGVAFSPDNRWLASAWGDGIVRIWDPNDRVGEARELPRHAGAVNRVLFLPDGRLASVGGKLGGSDPSEPREFGEVRIWDLSTEQALELRGHTRFVYGLACSLDGRRLVTGGDDRTIKLWDTTTGAEVITLRGHTAGLLSVAISPDGQRIASGGWDRTVRIWDISPPPTAATPLSGEAESQLKVRELPAEPFAR